MRAREVAFVGALVHRFPALLSLLQRHLVNYDGLLPHVFMGDVTRWIVKELDSGSDASASRIARFSWRQDSGVAIKRSGS
jgi:hypothetical protein